MINSNLTEEQLLMKCHYICSQLSILRGHEQFKGCEGGNLVTWGPIRLHCDIMQSQKKKLNKKVLQGTLVFL